MDAALDQEASDAATDRAWALADEEVKESKYARDLPQLSPEAGGRAAPLDPDPATWRCEASGDAENLWLNLSTGFIGGGRDQAAWGGPKGSNGALQHFEATGKKYSPARAELPTRRGVVCRRRSFARTSGRASVDARGSLDLLAGTRSS